MSSEWTAKTLPPELADTSQWRAVDAEALDEIDRARFLKYQAAIVAYLGTGKLTAIAQELGLSRNSIIGQMNRCATIAADGKPYGWAALIPGQRTGGYERKAALPSGRQETGGARAGAFQAFMLAYPGIKQKIDNLIFKRTANGVVHEARITLQNIHAAFVACCEQAGITGRQYPLNSKTRARRSVERYVTTVLQSKSEEAFMESARDHAFPPVTFDGEIAEYALGLLDPTQRLIIGRRYQMDDGKDGKRLGVLTSATVAENESNVYGALWFEDDTAEIFTWDMSEAELDVWRRHPDTFFGEPTQRSTNAQGPLELYEFFMNGYKNTPRGRLLELLQGSPDFTQLQ
jgi:hypothetical protein